MNGRTSLRPATALFLALVSASCGATTPREIVIGQDQCTYCRMEVTDPKFATQVILTTGKIVVFDAVDCLAGYVRGNPAERIKSVWVAAVMEESSSAPRRRGFCSTARYEARWDASWPSPHPPRLRLPRRRTVAAS